MSRLSFLLFSFLICTALSGLRAQPAYADTQFFLSSEFSDHSAIYLNAERIVDTYNSEGICRLSGKQKGSLTLSAVRVKGDEVTPTHTLPFRVAIRHQRSNSLWLYTPDPVRSVDLEEVFEACKHGDKIIILTEDKHYALPHNEIEVMWGC